MASQQVFRRPPRGMVFTDARPPSEESKALYRSGMGAFSAGQKDQALQVFRQAQAADPLNKEAARGVERLDDVREPPAMPASAEYYRRGLLAFQSGDEQAAEDFWLRAYETDPNNVEALRGLERLAAKRGQLIMPEAMK